MISKASLSAFALACISSAPLLSLAEDRPMTWAAWEQSKPDAALVKRIRKMEWWQACANWGKEVRAKKNSRFMWAVQDFLISREYLNGKDTGSISGAKVPEIGMTTCGAIAVLGVPERVNNTVTTYGHSTQLVWQSRRVYAYTQSKNGDGNALIRSVQY